MDVIVATSVRSKTTMVEELINELGKCLHLQPHQEKKIDVCLHGHLERLLVTKDESSKTFIIRWIKGNDEKGLYHVSTNINKAVQDIEQMLDTINGILAKEKREDVGKKHFEERCYHLYQMERMMINGFSIEKLLSQFSVLLNRSKDYRMAVKPMMESIGCYFKGMNAFLEEEYKDPAYMKWLFDSHDDAVAADLKEKYRKYTGINLNECCDLKVHTDAGTLRAYKLTDPDHPGIVVMLEPKGHDDVEIDVTMAEANGKDIQIVNWGDATTEDCTHSESLLWDDIEKTLAPKVLSPEELKKVIFDEWKKFTFYDGEHISADEIDNVPQDLLDEIAFRCDSLETDDITQNIRACLMYAKEHGNRALMKEMDDCNIWRYIG